MTGQSANEQMADAHVAALARQPAEVITATSMFADGETVAAERVIRDFLLRHGDHVEAMRLLAKIGMKLEVLDDAELLLHSLLEIAPEYHAARHDYALVLLGQKNAADVADTHAPCPGAFPAPLPNSQAARQGAMTREALCLIAAKPAAFVAKSLAELVDLFQINYTGAERFTNGFTTGRLPIAYVVGLFLLDDTLYILILPLAIIPTSWVGFCNGFTLESQWKLFKSKTSGSTSVVKKRSRERRRCLPVEAIDPNRQGGLVNRPTYFKRPSSNSIKSK